MGGWGGGGVRGGGGGGGNRKGGEKEGVEGCVDVPRKKSEIQNGKRINAFLLGTQENGQRRKGGRKGGWKGEGGMRWRW